MFIVALENLPKKHLLFDALQIIKLFVKERLITKQLEKKKNDGNQGCSVLAQCHLFFSKDNRKPGHVSC